MITNFSPINFAFVASGIAIKAKAGLCGFTSNLHNQPNWKGHDQQPDIIPSRQGDAPSWDGRRGEINPFGVVGLPITDIRHWESRYALTTLTLSHPDLHSDIFRSDNNLVMQEVIINISQQKQIVKTALNGLEGTVKEFVSNGDYDLRIQTAIVATDAVNRIIDEYPEAGIRTIEKYLRHNGTLNASSPFLDLFGISHIVITGYSMQCAADSNRQEISISALSDKDYIIRHEEY